MKNNLTPAERLQQQREANEAEYIRRFVTPAAPPAPVPHPLQRALSKAIVEADDAQRRIQRMAGALRAVASMAHLPVLTGPVSGLDHLPAHRNDLGALLHMLSDQAAMLGRDLATAFGQVQALESAALAAATGAC